MDALHIVPISLSQANQFVEKHHRHHHAIPICKFQIGVAILDSLVGVAIVGLPLSRVLMDGETLEVRRTCTDGTKNANSKLYGASWKVAQSLGYNRLITYTLPEEGGASLRAVGWEPTSFSKGNSWNTPKRYRLSRSLVGVKKQRWEIVNSLYKKYPRVCLDDNIDEDAQILMFEVTI